MYIQGGRAACGKVKITREGKKEKNYPPPPPPKKYF